MRRQRRYLACILAVLMTMSFQMSAPAEELVQGDEKTGIGELEGSVRQDIYQVVLPTVADDMFDFIMDPQGLINKTDGAAYDGKAFEEGSTLFFRRKDGEVEEDYSSMSDAITITNRSSMAIDVSVEISIAEESLGGIELTDDREFEDDTNASLYLALTDGENVIPVTTEGMSMNVVIDAAPKEAYEYKYDNEKEMYIYKIKDDISSIEFPQYSFRLVGATNRNGDWSELTDEVPKINVAWKIVPRK